MVRNPTYSPPKRIWITNEIIHNLVKPYCAEMNVNCSYSRSGVRIFQRWASVDVVSSRLRRTVQEMHPATSGAVHS